jgi:phosphoenolpyruvate carboxykinase (ATP)
MSASHQIQVAGRYFDLGQTVHFNLPVERLIEANIAEGRGFLSASGAVMIDTGKYTGRSPKDKYFVKESSSQDHIWWGSNFHKPVSDEIFETLFDKVSQYYQDQKEAATYVFDGFAGADPTHNIKIRIVAKRPWQAHFAYNMFIRPTEAQKVGFTPDFTIINASEVHNEDFEKHGLNSSTFIIFNLAKKIAIIGGTEYGGEMKKGIFTLLNYILPLRGVLSMHCAANVDPRNGDTALFFGLSGTGKTTLSTDPNRPLIGDDEHGWSEHGVFNFEGGCYAKVIKLSAEDEPQIFSAIRFGALLENVVFDAETRNIDYNSDSKTENTRVSYPIHFIENSLAAQGKESRAGHPKNIVFLTCDAYGVLPPVSKLTVEQAMYHYISGYTAKVAGTERGVLKPTPTFSPCFGAPFLALHPLKYAEILRKKIEDHNVNVYMVNTGWNGNNAESGAKRISLKATRKMISAVLDGSIEKTSFVKDPFFGVDVPTALEGVEASILNPRNAWADKDAYDQGAKALAQLFRDNFKKYGQEVAHLVSAGPVGQ